MRLDYFKKLNVLSFLVLLPAFWFVPVTYIFNYYYAAACAVFIIAAWYWRGFQFKPDPFLCWLIGYGFFVFLIDIFNGGTFFRFTAQLLFSLMVIGFVVFYRCGSRELFTLALVGALTFYIENFIDGRPFKHHGGAAYLAAAIIALCVLRHYKSALCIMILACVMLSRAAWLGLIVGLGLWYAFGISKRSLVFRRILLALLMIGLVATPIIIGKYFYNSKKSFRLTSSRSYNYHVLWKNFIAEGKGVFFSKSNECSEEVLKADLANDKVSVKNKGLQAHIKKFFKKKIERCVHSTQMQFLFNYGIILAVILLGTLILIENQWTWPIVACFFIVIGFQCQVFAVRQIVPFYLAYRVVFLKTSERKLDP